MLDNLVGSSESEVVEKMRAARSGEDQTSEPIEPTDEAVEEPQTEEIQEEVSEDVESVDEQEQEGEEPELYTVKVGGEEREVSFDDLLGNYSKGEDYTNKTMKLADERKEFEAQKIALTEQTEAEKQKYAELATQLQSLVQEQDKNQEYWDELRETDPSEYLRQKEDLEVKKQKVQEFQAEQAKALDARRADESKKLITAMGDDWKSDEAIKKDTDAMRSYALKMGISDQEMPNILDHRFWLIVRDAMRYQDIINTGDAVKKQVKSAPKTVKSKRPIKRTAQEAEKAQAKLRASGGKDLDAAVALMKAKRNR